MQSIIFTHIKRVVLGVLLLVSVVFSYAVQVDAASTSNFQVTINPGALSVDIADSTGGFSSVSSPSLSFAAQSFSFACQSTTGTFGSTTEALYIQNPDAADNGWSVTLAASSTTAVWESAASSTVTFDYNDVTTAGCGDGGDGDNLAGRLTIDPSGATVATGTCATCSATGVSLGSSASFDEGTTDSVTIVTGSAGSDDFGDWMVTGVALTQTLPAEQAAFSDYAIDMILSIVAS